MPDYDLIIVGGGPAGLAAAINASSEGLKTCLIDSKDQLGGQASASAAIENYPGFPDGVTGKDLTTRFLQQAQRFEVKFFRPAVAQNIKIDGDERIIITDDGQRISGLAVILALGLSYKRLDAKGVSDFLGRGVSYGMPVIDSTKEGQCFCVVGGANSAGQAAVHLSKIRGCEVKMLVRGPSLNESMSQYLIERITAITNIEVLTRTEVVEARGAERLAELLIKQGEETRAISANGLYVFIGARPKTYWLNGSVQQSERGYILTGRRLTPPNEGGRNPMGFETSIPGVFACGDVREGSTKRIASAVGEGSVAVQQVHEYLGLSHQVSAVSK